MGRREIEFGQDNYSTTNCDLYRKQPLFKCSLDVPLATYTGQYRISLADLFPFHSSAQGIYTNAVDYRSLKQYFLPHMSSRDVSLSIQ